MGEDICEGNEENELIYGYRMIESDICNRTCIGSYMI